jgi:hypothetical protein
MHGGSSAKIANHASPRSQPGEAAGAVAKRSIAVSFRASNKERASWGAERRDKIAADYGLKLLAEEQKRIAVEKWLRLEKTKRVMELDRNLIAIAVVITALPIIAAFGLDAYRPRCGRPITPQPLSS